MNHPLDSSGRAMHESHAAARGPGSIGALRSRRRRGGITDHPAAFALAGYVLFLLWHSLVPSTGLDASGVTAPPRQLGLPLVTTTYPDTLGNILLYIPLGALLAWTARKRGRSHLGVTVTSTLIIAALSYLIETVQDLMSTRIASYGDWVCNTMGGAVGAAAIPVALLMAEILVAAWRRDLRRAPLFGATHLYTLALAVVALAPWLFTFDVSTVRNNLRAAMAAPAWQRAPAALRREYHDESSYLADLHARRERLECTWNAAYEFGTFALLAWLVMVTLRDGFGFAHLPRVLLGLWITLGFALALGGAQLLVRHNGVHVYAVLARGIGCAAGTALSLNSRLGALPTSLFGSFVARGHVLPQPLAASALATIVFAHLYLSWVPFVVHVDINGPRMLNAPSWWPLHGYAASAWLPAAHDALNKLLRFMLFGFVAAASTRPEPRRQNRRTLRIAVAALAIACAGESLQVFVPGRYPDVTELGLAVLGALTGCVIFARLFGTPTQPGSLDTSYGPQVMPAARRT